MCDIFAMNCGAKGCTNKIPIHIADFVLPRNVIKKVYCKEHIPTKAGQYDIYILKLERPTITALRKYWIQIRKSINMPAVLSKEDEKSIRESVKEMMWDYKSEFNPCALEVDTKEAKRLLKNKNQQRWLTKSIARSLGISPKQAEKKIQTRYLPIVPKAICLNTACSQKITRCFRAEKY